MNKFLWFRIEFLLIEMIPSVDKFMIFEKQYFLLVIFQEISSRTVVLFSFLFDLYNIYILNKINIKKFTTISLKNNFLTKNIDFLLCLHPKRIQETC